MSTHSQPRSAVLLVNLGSPAAPTSAAVRAYLGEFLCDRRVVELPRPGWWLLRNLCVVPLRSPGVAKSYAKIFTGRGAPLVYTTADIATALGSQLGQDVLVGYAMRYGSPSLADALGPWRDAPLERLLVLPLYPQYAASTVGSLFDALASELRHWRWVPQLTMLGSYHDSSAYIDALAGQIAGVRKPDHLLLVSFHGLPLAMLEKGDPYYCQCHKTARLLAGRLGLKASQWRLCFQSRFGRQSWLQPYAHQLLAKLPGEGITKVQVVCPGFAVDCLETLLEAAEHNRQIFLAAGGESYAYIPCLNNSPAHSTLLAELVAPHLDVWRQQDAARLEPGGSHNQLQLYQRANQQVRGTA